MATNTKTQTAATLASARAAQAMTAAEQSLSKTIATAEQQLAKTVETATKGLNDAVATTVQELGTLSTKVEDKRAELDALTGEYAQKLDVEQYNLRIAVRDNRLGTLNTLLREEGLVAVKPAELDAMKQDLAAAQQDNAETIAKEVGKAQGMERAKAEREKAQLEADHKVELAEHTATAKSDATTIKLLTEQLEQARADLKAEREARVKVEEHRSQAAGVTVNTTTK